MSTQESSEGRVGMRRPRVGHMLGMIACVMALGFLFWAKLRLVVSMPRTAIAQPEKQGASEETTGGRGEQVSP